MSNEIYRYLFAPTVPFDEAEASLLLAIIGAESLHGEADVRLNAAYATDNAKRTVVIDATRSVGSDINHLFVGYLTREFGEGSFQVEHIDEMPKTERTKHEVA